MLIALAEVWTAHPEIYQAQADVRVSRLGVTTAALNFIPFVTVDATLARRNDDAIARLVLPIFRGGASLAEWAGAHAAVRSAESQLGQVQVRLAQRLIDAWFRWTSAHQQDALWRAHLAQLEVLKGSIERRAAEGVATEAEVVNIQSRLLQAQAQAERNHAQLLAARAQVQALVGQRTLGVPQWPSAQRVLTPTELQDVWAQAMARHPDILRAQATIEEQQAERRANRGRALPEVQLRLNEPLGERRTANAETESVELFVQYRSDSGLRAVQAMRASSESESGALAALQATLRELEADIRASQADLASFTLQRRLQREGADTAVQLVDSFLRQYEVGRKNWLEVLNAVREANETQLQLVQQTQGFWTAHQRLALQGLYWERLLKEDAR